MPSGLLPDRGFRLLADAVEDRAVFLLDERGVVLTWNAGAERIKGYGPEEIVGQHFRRLYLHEDADAGLPDRVLETARARGRYEGEGWRLRKDGTPFWASVTVTALREGGGDVLGYAKVTRDLTQRRGEEERRAALLVRRAEEVALAAAFGSAADALLLTDAGGVVQIANAAAERLLNVRAGFFERRRLVNVVARQDVGAMRALVGELAGAPPGTARQVLLRLRPRGQPVFVASLEAMRTELSSGARIQWTIRAAGPCSASG